MTSLTRYWLEFPPTLEGSERRFGFPRVGVTAFSLDDALGIVRDRLLNGVTPPELAHVVEDVDIQELDENHVRNQMSPPNMRGIWYPRGFEG